jgi:two-component system invasion response regulator UvrY
VTDHQLIKDVLVDDAAELRSMLRVLLERSRLIAVVGEAGDSRAAGAFLDTDTIDAVVVDLAMPGGGALELIQRLRTSHPLLAIVVLSGYPAATTEASCIERGADVYVEKGTPIALLVSAIHDAVVARKV